MKSTYVPCLLLAGIPALVTGPVALAVTAPPAEIVIPGEKIFPESLTSTADGSVIVGSIAAKTIFRAKPGSATAEAWIQPGTDGLGNIHLAQVSAHSASSY
jgi:hypothetical protein